MQVYIGCSSLRCYNHMHKSHFLCIYNLATNSHQAGKGIYHLGFLSFEDTASYYNRSIFLGVSLRQEGAGS